MAFFVAIMINFLHLQLNTHLLVQYFYENIEDLKLKNIELNT